MPDLNISGLEVAFPGLDMPALRIADLGWKEALRRDPHLAAGLNVHAGRVTYPAVAQELGYDLLPVADVLA